MSDYLTRLIERSLGLPPQIEPLIAPIHAPSDQMLSETMETPAVFESTPAAKIETSERGTLSGVAVNTRAVGPAFSRTGSQPPRASSALPESPKAFPIEKKDERPHPTESRPKVLSRPTSSTPRPGAVVVQPEIMSPLKPAASPFVAVIESSPKEQPLLPRMTTTASQGNSQIVVQPEIISPLKPAASPPFPARKPSPKEPPAIHVTIGRLEVRAVMPRIAATKSTSPPTPKLSLEDYLKQRNGGRS